MNMSEEELEDLLTEALYAWAEQNDEPEPTVETFARMGLLTQNHGLVVRIGEAEFYLTIVRSEG